MDSQYGVVFPVLPSYNRHGRIDLAHVASYAAFLGGRGAQTLMTTAGTTQFNLLTVDEIFELNVCAAEEFRGRVICGLPSLAEGQLAPLVVKLAERLPSASIMLIYPERIYNDADVVAFFERITRLVPNSFYVHGLPVRRGNGVADSYNAGLVKRLFKSAPKIVGMKEESPTYEMGFELCAACPSGRTFEFIVAGGSMRRFLLLQAAGAQSFFAGIGSLFPSIELAFMRAIKRGDLRVANQLIAEFETPVFNVFMPIGWHIALRYAAKKLDLIAYGERRPMPLPTKSQRSQIDATIDVLQARFESAVSLGLI